MEKSRVIKGFVYSLISAAAFASLIILAKLGYMESLSAKEMLLWRFTIGAIAMTLFLLTKDHNLVKPTMPLLKKALITGAIFYTAQSYCFVSSAKYVQASVSELILYLYPAGVAVLAAAVFKEKLNLYKLFYIALLLTGLIFIFKNAFDKPLQIKGILCALGAMLIYSMYLIAIQKLGKNEHPASFAYYTILFAALCFWIMSGIPRIPQTLNGIIIITLLGIVTTVVAIGFLFAAIHQIGAALSSVFSSMEPVITIVLSMIILKSSLNLSQAIGAFFILTGVALANGYHLKRTDR